MNKNIYDIYRILIHVAMEIDNQQFSSYGNMIINKINKCHW